MLHNSATRAAISSGEKVYLRYSSLHLQGSRVPISNIGILVAEEVIIITIEGGWAGNVLPSSCDPN